MAKEPDAGLQFGNDAWHRGKLGYTQPDQNRCGDEVGREAATYADGPSMRSSGRSRCRNESQYAGVKAVNLTRDGRIPAIHRQRVLRQVIGPDREEVGSGRKEIGGNRGGW